MGTGAVLQTDAVDVAARTRPALAPEAKAAPLRVAGPLDPRLVMGLQRGVGNAAVQRLLGRSTPARRPRPVQRDDDPNQPAPAADGQAPAADGQAPADSEPAPDVGNSQSVGADDGSGGDPGAGGAAGGSGGGAAGAADDPNAQRLPLGERDDGSVIQRDDDGTTPTTTTCPANADDVGFTTKNFTVDAAGLSDVDKKVRGKFSGIAGHVSLAAMPSWKALCKDDQGNVGAAKVTAKGTVNAPARGTVGHSTADPDREEKGIVDYFNIVQTHEASHAKIYTDAFTGLAAKLVGKSQADADTAFNAAVCAAFTAQDALDNSEGCVTLCCTDGAAKDASKGPASNCGLTPNAADSCKT